MRQSSYAIRLGWNGLRERTHVSNKKVFVWLAALFIVGSAVVAGAGLIRVRSQVVGAVLTPHDPVPIMQTVTAGYYGSDANQPMSDR